MTSQKLNLLNQQDLKINVKTIIKDIKTISTVKRSYSVLFMS